MCRKTELVWDHAIHLSETVADMGYGLSCGVTSVRSSASETRPGREKVCPKSAVVFRSQKRTHEMGTQKKGIHVEAPGGQFSGPGVGREGRPIRRLLDITKEKVDVEAPGSSTLRGRF